MTLRAPIVGLVLAAFVATTAVPGPQVVAHQHEGGEHGHVHGHLHDYDHHDHPEAHEHAHHHPELVRPKHGDGLVAWDGEPRDHVHVISPFQAATGATPARVVHVAIVTSLDAAAPVAPPAPSSRPERSRGPPSAAHV